MGNDTRNDKELPCYMDVGLKLFPEALAGQALDLTDPNTRDQALTKHIIREGQKIGYKPVRIWLLSHRDVMNSNAQTGPQTVDGTKDNDFYGDGGGGPIVGKSDLSNPADPGGSGANFYNEMPTKVYSGPFVINTEYVPNSAEHVLLDLGVERQYNDMFNFLIEDAQRILGRVPFVGDVVERFDGMILEIMTSTKTGPETWEYLYQTCAAVNTSKDYTMFFNGRVPKAPK